MLGAGSEMAKLLVPDAAAALSGAGAERSNFQVILEQARRFTGNGTEGKGLQAEMLQHYFGLVARQRHRHRCAGRRQMGYGTRYQSFLRRTVILAAPLVLEPPPDVLAAGPAPCGYRA